MCPVWVHDRRCMEEEQKDWLIGQLCFSICCPYYLGEETSAITPWVWQDLDVRQAFEKDHREMLKERLIENSASSFLEPMRPVLGRNRSEKQSTDVQKQSGLWLNRCIWVHQAGGWIAILINILVSGTWMFGTAATP